jgi:hypothetical protein
MVELEQYLLVLGQEGEGCDYTIGCGKTYMEILLPSNQGIERTEALKKVTIEYFGGDNRLSEILLIPMSAVEKLPVEDWYHEKEMKQLENKKASERDKELKQLEYLRKKYEQ